MNTIIEIWKPHFQIQLKNWDSEKMTFQISDKSGLIQLIEIPNLVHDPHQTLHEILLEKQSEKRHSVISQLFT